MNKKENLKASVIECCINGTMTIKVAADRLGFLGCPNQKLLTDFWSKKDRFIFETV